MSALETIKKRATAATGKAASHGEVRVEGIGFPTSTGSSFMPTAGTRGTQTTFGATTSPLEKRYVFSSATPTPEAPPVEGVRAADFLLTARGGAEHEARIQKLQARTCSPGWDDEGGASIRSEQWEAARVTLGFVLRCSPEAPRVFISACGDGTVHLTWTNGVGDRGVLEIGVSELWWSYLPAGGGGDEFEPLGSAELLKGKLARLRK